MKNVFGFSLLSLFLGLRFCEEYVLLVAERNFGLLVFLGLILRIVDLRLRHIVAAARAAEAVCQVRADARARRLLGLNPVRVEAGDDLVDAHQMRNGGAAMDGSRSHAALEEAWRKAVCHALENVRLAEDLTELDAVSVGLLPLGN